GVAVVRGSETDVLGRFALVARTYPEVHWIVRWTADNPVTDIAGPVRVLTSLPHDADYAMEEGLPVGGAVEVMSRRALLEAHARAQSAFDREHVTPWLRRMEASRRVTLTAPEECQAPDLRLTVDTHADLEAMRRVAQALEGQG